ncbi:hypothetical protein D3C87_911610 [compost metagenome]
MRHRYILFFALAMCISCKMDKSKNEKHNIGLFFRNTSWVKFNDETLKDNNLQHFIDAKIDFFHRENFFMFMQKSEYNDPYNEFYLIEIEKPKGETPISKKIIVVLFNNSVKSIALQKHIDKWDEINLSDNELKKYKYDGLKKSYKTDTGEYIMITKIIDDKFN